MTSYDPAFESQKFMAEVTQTGETQANAMRMHAGDQLVDSVKTAVQSRANRAEQAREFDASMALQKSKLAADINEHTQRFSLEQQRFKQELQYNDVMQQVAQEKLRRAQIENSQQMLADEAALRQEQIRASRAEADFRAYQLESAKRAEYANVASGMSGQDQEEYIRRVAPSLMGDGVYGPQRADAGASEMHSMVSLARRKEQFDMLSRVAQKFIEQDDPEAAREIMAIGMQLSSGKINADQAQAMISAKQSSNDVAQLGGLPRDDKRVQEAIAKLPESAREIHDRMLEGSPLGVGGRIKTADWLDRNYEALFDLAARYKTSDRPLDKERDRKQIMDWVTSAIRNPQHPMHSAFMVELFDFGPMSKEDLGEYQKMMSEPRFQGWTPTLNQTPGRR